jgi:hypothetical protein
VRDAVTVGEVLLEFNAASAVLRESSRRQPYSRRSEQDDAVAIQQKGGGRRLNPRIPLRGVL